VHRVVESLKKQGEAQYIEGILDEPSSRRCAAGERRAPGEADPLYDQAVQIVLQNKRASISLVQRHLRIGYNRAARLIEDMEKAGLVTPMASQREPRDHPALQVGCNATVASRRALHPGCSCLPRRFANGLDDFLAFNTATKTATARFEQQVFDRSARRESAAARSPSRAPASSAGPTTSRTSRCSWATA
jgi:hypothetical protein